MDYLDPNDLRDFEPQDYRSSIRKVDAEIEELQQERLKLMREKRTLETVMYMLFPKEAIRDGYLDGNREVAQRLRRAKERREKNLPEKMHSASLGAIQAENIAKGFKNPPRQVVR